MNQKFIQLFTFVLCAPFKAFHDCVGPDGCDGCLNVNDTDNAGLTDIVEDLTSLRNGGFRRYDSFADVIIRL